MSALQRSQSAPQPIASLAASSSKNTQQKPLARTVSHEHVHHRPHQALPKPLATVAGTWPTEDPFNLSSFFPPERRHDWQWVRQEMLPEEEEEDEAENDDKEEAPAIFVPPEDKDASEVIKGEDKLGILSFGSVGGYSEDSVLLSPYSLDDAVDEESLFAHYRRRRARASW